MKKICSFLALKFLTTITCLPVFATISPKVPQDPHQFSLGLEFFHYNYREPGVMNLKGFLYGANAAYNYTFINDFFIQPDFRFSYGHTDYKSNRTGSLKHEPNWLSETRFVFGKRFKLASITELDPYLGFGYRYKADDSKGKKSTTGHSGYRRKSQYLYIPVGLTLHQQLSCDWALAPTAEFDWFLHGRQSSYVSSTIHNNQKRGYGLKGDLMLIKKFSHSSFSFGPFINYWNIKDSNIKKVQLVNRSGEIVGEAGIFEPRNNTIEVGIKLNYNF
ncbi:MAG: autotransporter outer membrane beta-barrel domain-containing protein [Alphaproteobacteria bacterium]|nr:autotransporter outer membrane beta-barrel domain-containing protein [Alphaproteobacteria bacterium]